MSGAKSHRRTVVADPRPHAGYVPALDGIRALAVAAVLAFHGGMPWASGGFLGVDAFFVLSGYLITTLLLAEWQRTGGIALAAFWGRRARRLLPALLLVILAVTIGARHLLPPEDIRPLRGDGIAAVFYIANWRMILSGGDYFAQTAAPSPLEHTWSLAIEEQFYLLWPLLLLVLLAGRRPLRRLVAVCAVGAVASAVGLALLYSAADPGRAYFGTDTRAASLLVGAALAAVLATRDRSAGPLRPGLGRSMLGGLALVGAGATVWAWTHLSGADGRLYHGGLAAGAVAVAAVLAHIALVPGGLSARILSVPPLPALGRISYGVYLWHWPVFIAANAERTGLHGPALFTLRCLVTVAIATASYVLVERPIRSGAFLRQGRIALTSAAGAVAAAVVLVATTALPSLPGEAAAGSMTDGIDRVGAHASHSDSSVAAAQPAGARLLGQRVVVDVFGDSVAWSLVANLPSHPGLDIRDRTIMGCGVTRAAPFRYWGEIHPTWNQKCPRWPRLWRRAITSDDPDIAFVLVGRWETMDAQLEGRWTHLGGPAFDAYLMSELGRAVSVAGAGGARVVLATEPYNRRHERLDGSLYPEDRPGRVTHWNALLREFAAAHPGVKVLEFGKRVCPDGRFTWTAGGVRIRTDGLHLAPEGVGTWIAPWLFPRLLAAAPT
jgi:peptidoglycan/LPS O-acetylase OafA/YrhL